MSAVYLSHFLSVRPQFELKQEEAIERLIDIRLRLNPELRRSDVERRIRRFGLANSKIKARGSELEDYSLDLKDESIPLQFFKEGSIPLLETRMEHFDQGAARVFAEWYDAEEQRPDHILHVSCTGYAAPNVAQKTVAKWPRPAAPSVPTTVTNAYHMGCYASLPAVRMARGFAMAGASRVDIAHNEMCSLHFDPLTLEPEQIVVQSLFADGHIRYSLNQALPESGFKVLSLAEEVVADSADQMTWIPSSTHFKMQLSRLVPDSIRKNLPDFVARLLRESDFPESGKLIFAIHPGGPKIIEAVEEILNLNPEQTIESHAVLSEFGNMSSATLPHIWQKILANPERTDETYILSLAFGPGLTLSGAVFQLCKHR